MEAMHKSSISTLNKPNGNDSSHYCKACSTACLHSKQRERKNEKMMGYEDHLVHIHHSWMHYIHQLAIHRPGCCLKYIEPDSYYELISISNFSSSTLQFAREMRENSYGLCGLREPTSSTLERARCRVEFTHASISFLPTKYAASIIPMFDAPISSSFHLPRKQLRNRADNYKACLTKCPHEIINGSADRPTNPSKQSRFNEDSTNNSYSILKLSLSLSRAHTHARTHTNKDV